MISFTEAGHRKNRELVALLAGTEIDCAGYYKGSAPGCEGLQEISDMRIWMKEGWGRDAYLFIGATGIAVRSIAPFVRDKLTDSPVLVMDEKGKYLIPLLSSHVGGAGALAERIAACNGAVPVVTTATDLNGKFAVDVFAVRNGMTITDKKVAKEISARILRGEQVNLYSDFPIDGEIPEELRLLSTREEKENQKDGIAILEKVPRREHPGILYLYPKILSVGIGCRRGVGKEKIETEIRRILKADGWKMEQIAVVASVDRKADEQGIVDFAKEYGIPYETYTPEELNAIEGISTSSEFVKRITGTDNVCERAALLAGNRGKLIHEKEAVNHLTVAVVRMDRNMILKEKKKEKRKETGK